MTIRNEQWLFRCVFAAGGIEWTVDAAAPEAIASLEDGRLTVVFAGALYNRDAVRASVRSDAEYVAQLWMRDGEKSVGSLRGHFAFVVVERAQQAAIAVRDPLGTVPLFCREEGASTSFSPSIEKIAALAPGAPNRALLAEHLADVWTSSTETYLEGVTRVASGSRVELRGEARRTTRYWDPSTLPMRADAEAIGREFQQRLGGAVEGAMRLGRSGLFLSGGIDSISIAALAREVSQRTGLEPPIALSLLYRDSEINEEDAQSYVAAALGLESSRIPLDAALEHEPPVQSLLRHSAGWPAPMWNLWLPGFIALARDGRRHGCEVVMTGGGGDEWLGVGPHLAADYLRRLDVRGYWRFLKVTRRSYAMPTAALLRNLVWSFGLRMLVHDLRNRVVPHFGYDLDASRARRALPDWLAPDPRLRRDIIDRVRVVRRHEREERTRLKTFYAFEARRSLDHPIVVMEMENKYFMGQAAGVRMIEPYWDPSVVELLYQTPPEVLNRGGSAKGLAHEILDRMLPGFTIPAQKKLALSDFYRTRVRGEAATIWASMGGARLLGELGVVDPKLLDARIARITAEPGSRDIWMIPHILTLEAWARARFGEG